MQSEEYITLELAMKRLKLSRRQVYRYAQENRIRTMPSRSGQLYHRNDVEDLAQALKVDEKPEPLQLEPYRPERDRAALTKEIDELRSIRAEISTLVHQQHQQYQLTTQKQTEATEQQARLDLAIRELEAAQGKLAQLDHAIAELEAARSELARPFYRRWEFWIILLLLCITIFLAFFR